MSSEEIVEKIISELKKLDFIIHRYNAKSTESIYLKLDYGVCCGIRISDHNGRKKYHYRFNVYKDYKGDKIIQRDNLISYFYTFDEIPELIEKVLEEKKDKIKRYGIDRYKLYMKTELEENDLFNRFKEVI